MTTDPKDLDTKYVEEAPETGDAFARQLSRWITGIPLDGMLLFVEEVRKNAAAATSANAQAQQAAKATATDVSRTQQAVRDARGAAEQAAGHVVVAQTAVTQATQQATLAAGASGRSESSAVRSEAAAKRAQQIVDEFNPWINQYGYSKVVELEVDRYLITEKDLGKTLVFKRPTTVVLPAKARDAFPESFFFHVTTEKISDDIWIDYDHATDMTHIRHHWPMVRGGYRGTIQLLGDGHWRLFDPLIPIRKNVGECDTRKTTKGQCHGTHYTRESLDGAWRWGLLKQYGKLNAWSLDLLGGVLNNRSMAVPGNLEVLPDGELEMVYSSRPDFTGKMLFGAYLGAEKPKDQLGFYWAESGFTGNVYAMTIDGYRGTDWFITGLVGEFAEGVKHALVTLTSRHLKEPNGDATVKYLVITSTDGFSWFENRFSVVNGKFGPRKVIAHFPFTIMETGEVYLQEHDGSITLLTYAITPNTWVEKPAADGFDSIVQQKAWTNGSYAFVFLNSGDLNCFTHSGSMNKTVSNNETHGIVNACSESGDAIRQASVVAIERGTYRFLNVRFVLDEENPDGYLIVDEHSSFSGNYKEVYQVGSMVMGIDFMTYYVLGRSVDDNELLFQTSDDSSVALPWKDATTLGYCKYEITNRIIPVIATSLGLFYDRARLEEIEGPDGGDGEEMPS